MEVSKCLVENIHCAFSGGLHFTAPIASLRTNEVDLVRGVLQILQGLSSSLFYWDQTGRCFCAKKGIYVTHLSLTSLHAVLNQFTYAATCLRLVEIIVNKLKNAGSFSPPTLRAFACSVSAWLTRLRDIALKEEVNICSSDGKFVPTLLGLASSLSSICSGAEYLLQMVHGAIPQVYLEREPPVMASDIAVHILNYLYKKLNEVSLVQGGEEDAYWMLLYIFVGSLLPYIEVLDSWLFEGTLDDPFEEMFFYANKGIAIDEAEFWERSYLLKQTEYHKLDATPRESLSLSGSAKDAENGRDLKVCPLFLKDIAMAIISAGKSLQLIRHSPTFSTISCNKNEVRHSIAGLTFSEVFCVSLAALVGHGDHISEHIWRGDGIISSSRSVADKQTQNNENLPPKTCSEKIWYKYLVDIDTVQKRGDDFIGMRTNLGADAMHEVPLVKSLFPENPAITVCQRFLHDYKDAWKSLNLSMNFCLPPLNDVDLRQAVFGKKTGNLSVDRGTDYTYGFLFGESEHLSSHGDAEMLEKLFPFPTLLPPFKEDHRMSEFLPFQKNSTIPSRVLNSIISVEPKATPLPVVILQECLIVHIKKQVDYIGRNILSKLLNDWRLMDELGVLRAIYLLGSGDLLQHFLTVIFNKLDKGESWDDEFELNTILQESIRNSADGMLLSADDSLIVSISKSHGFSGDEQHNPSILVSTPRKGRAQFGIDVLDSLKFTYKVSWPLELIANTEAIKKYNKVMSFLLKVKRAKFVLDKVRRWMWKDRSTMTINRKRHWLVEQKLLHFVDAFHQYVMDRVYHSAWRELCEGMAAAGSLDQVIEVHEAYLLSIQRQCFAVPDKLWALIASRINSILRLALDFYSIQQTLCGGVISAVKARCEMEVDRIDKQFDDCIAFLLRVLSFKLNVGQFPHLADLVTRINYNYFYMSDSGNLITAPGSDTVPVASSKLGKAFPVRKD